MDKAKRMADFSLEATSEMLQGNGFTDAFRALVQEVYSQNLDRYEPEELGDTLVSLGIQCSENIKVRSLRRFRHSENEVLDNHWSINDLQVGTPQNVLTFSFKDIKITTMKVPSNAGRSPDWDHMGDWEKDSHARNVIASKNSEALEYQTPKSVDIPLFPHLGTPGEIQNYMVLWAGEANTALTAGWLAVPILGKIPFLAHKLLWWDDEPRSRITVKSTPGRGLSFDQRPATQPEISLKKQFKKGKA